MEEIDELLQLVEGSVTEAQQIVTNALLYRLNSAKTTLLRPLELAAPSATSRQAVQRGQPEVRGASHNISSSDCTEVLRLSDALALDELESLEHILKGYDQTGEISAEAGAGAFFEARRLELSCLWRLLHLHALPGAGLAPEVLAAIQHFNSELLAVQHDGHLTLLHHLIHLLKKVPRAGEGLRFAVDSHGNVVQWSSLVASERLMLCQVLVYAVAAHPRLPTATITDLLELLQAVATRIPRSAGEDQKVEAKLVLIAALTALLPQAGLDGDDHTATDDYQQFCQMGRNQQLAAKFQELKGIASPYAAAACFAWGLAQAEALTTHQQDAAVTSLRHLLEGRVLGFLREQLLSPGFLASAPATDSLLYAQTIHQLLMQFICCDLITREGGPLEDLMEAEVAPEPARDSLTSLVSLLAVVYKAFPDLYLDPALRYDKMVELMEWLPRQSLLRESPELLVAYLGLLAALASVPEGAREVTRQLQGGNYDIVSWDRMFSILTIVHQRYADSAENKLEEEIVPASDAAGLAAFLDLLACVLRNTEEGEIEERVRQLETIAGVAPLWELLFQLMCFPVPQVMKARLDEVIGAFASQPEVAGQIWDRLLAAVVVQPFTPQEPTMLGPSIHYDITYQLQEIEAKEQDYSETLAFVRLLNLLWKSKSSMSEYGMPYAHFTYFVLHDVLGPLHQRSYRDPSQKWQLAAAAFEHMTLVLASLPTSAQLPGTHFDPMSPLLPPGFAAILDLLGERPGGRVVMSLASCGPDALAAAQATGAEGRAQEAAVLAALGVLNTAMEHDSGVVTYLQQAGHAGYHERLEGVLRHDRRRLAALLDMVRYPDHAGIQAEAILLAQTLSQRIDKLVAFILQLDLPDAGAPLDVRLQAGFAARLRDSLFGLTSMQRAPAGEALDRQDVRADLILQLIADDLCRPGLQLAHLLLGFQVSSGYAGLANCRLAPKSAYSCLTVLLEGAIHGMLPQMRPHHHERCLAILSHLASTPETRGPTLDVLRSNSILLQQLDFVGCATLRSEPDQGPTRAAQLRQKAWLLRLACLELFHADAAVPSCRTSILNLLDQLFLPPADSEDGTGSSLAMEQRRSRMLEMLDRIAFPVALPSPDRYINGQALRTLQRYRLDVLLDSSAVTQEGGIRAVTEHGDSCIDVDALYKIIESRGKEDQGSIRGFGGPIGPAQLAQAGQAAISYAQEWNASVQQAGAQRLAVSAWQSTLEVAFTLRYEMLGQSLAGPGALALAGGAGAASDPACLENLQETLLQLLLTVHPLLLVPGAMSPIALPLCQAVQTLMARLELHATASAWPVALASGSLNAGVRQAGRCHELLEKLLLLLQDGRQVPSTRPPLYAALCSYLRLCRNPGQSQIPPSLLNSALDGVQGVADLENLAAQLDEAQAQLEGGNAALLLRASFLIDLLMSDARTPGQSQADQTLALMLLQALIASDPTSHFAAAISTAGLPQFLLNELARFQVGGSKQAGKGRASVQEAQLALLQSLVQAGTDRPHAPEALRRLPAAQLLPSLRMCQWINMDIQGSGSRDSERLRGLRARLLGPLLRTILLAVAPLRDSPEVQAAACLFIRTHHHTLQSILIDAASPGTRLWEPGTQELRLATLVLQLLTQVPGDQQSLPECSADLKDSAFRLLMMLADQDAHSTSPAVLRCHRCREEPQVQQSSPQELAGLIASIAELRGAAVHFMRRQALQKQHALQVNIRRQDVAHSSDQQVPDLLQLRDLLAQTTQDLFDLLEDAFTSPANLPRDSNPGAIVLQGDNGASSSAEDGVPGHIAHLEIDRQASLFRYIIEHCLGIMFFSLQQHLPSGSSVEEIDALHRRVHPILLQLEMLRGLANGSLAQQPQQQQHDSLQALVLKMRREFQRLLR
ncbi:hypothetical protein WJX74_003584 [Apatococcus lobatus]|uniref:Nuclear pore complex protein Nup205 n=1 Tax=Apatococcus lobatus TaxID=904363 RepID=A0AAW1Q964_9CHLO